MEPPDGGPPFSILGPASRNASLPEHDNQDDHSDKRRRDDDPRIDEGFFLRMVRTKVTPLVGVELHDPTLLLIAVEDGNLAAERNR